MEKIREILQVFSSKLFKLKQIMLYRRKVKKKFIFFQKISLNTSKNLFLYLEILIDYAKISDEIELSIF
jgi:hypothetical protein